MKKKIKIICVVLFGLTLLITACNNNHKKNATTDNIDYSLYPNQEASDITVFFSDSNITVAKLSAKRSRIYQDKAKTFLDSSVYIEFFSRTTGNRISTLTADSAIIDDLTKNMIAYGNVTVISDSNQTKLQTKLLEWNNKDKKVYTTEYIVISSPVRIIRGFGFESDLGLKNYTIYKVSGEEFIQK